MWTSLGSQSSSLSLRVCFLAQPTYEWRKQSHDRDHHNLVWSSPKAHDHRCGWKNRSAYKPRPSSFSLPRQIRTSTVSPQMSHQSLCRTCAPFFSNLWTRSKTVGCVHLRHVRQPPIHYKSNCRVLACLRVSKLLPRLSDLVRLSVQVQQYSSAAKDYVHTVHVCLNVNLLVHCDRQYEDT